MDKCSYGCGKPGVKYRGRPHNDWICSPKAFGCPKYAEFKKKAIENKFGVGITNVAQLKSVKDKKVATCRKKYGKDHHMQDEKIKEKQSIIMSSDEVQAKSKNTNKERYGTEYILNKDSPIREQRDQTMLEKYDTTNPQQILEVRERTTETYIEKHGGLGFASPSIKKAFDEHMLETWDTINPQRNEDIRKRTSETWLKEYGGIGWASEEVRQKAEDTLEKVWGYRHSSQVPELFEKQQFSALKFKKFVMKNGRLVYVQGYESFALIELQELYLAEDIAIGRSEVPSFHYIDFNGFSRVHHPDIYISKENKYIEVKSHYTYYEYLQTNLCKKKAALELGFKYEFWIYNNKGKIIEVK